MGQESATIGAKCPNLVKGCLCGILLFIAALVEPSSGFSQTLPQDVQKIVSQTGYRARLALFDEFPVRPGDVVFLGDNLIQQGQWDEIFVGVPVRNRGIWGDRVEAIQYRLYQISHYQPSAIILNIGANDLASGRSVQQVVAEIDKIVGFLSEVVSPDHIIIIGQPPLTAKAAPLIKRFNGALAQMSRAKGVNYIDVFPALVGRQDALYGSFAVDGRLLNGKGYRVIAEMLLPYLIKIAGEQREAQQGFKGQDFDLTDPMEARTGVAAGGR